MYSLEIELTQRCNLNCSYCYANTRPTGVCLSFESAKQIIDQAREYGIRRIAWLGGEPTLNPCWIKILAYCKESGIKNELWSNGTTLNPKTIQSIIELCDVFVLHLDSIDPKDFVKYQSGKATESIHQSIIGGFEELLKSGFPSHNVRINITLAKHNYGHLEETLKYFIQKKNVLTTTLIPLYPAGRGKKTYSKERLTKREIHHAFWLRAKTEQLPALLYLGPSEFCKQYQLTTAYIGPTGEIFPYAGIDQSLGNIFQERVEKIMEKKFKSNSFGGIVSPDGTKNRMRGPCRNCKSSAFCFGTRAYSFFLSGKLNLSDPNCWIK